ncbi:MAG TPA: hypothetical protein VFG10_04930 [Saprospiraceae bacterium]|nr:hypothetical protein [Saprospiraceae bacterium]
MRYIVFIIAIHSCVSGTSQASLTVDRMQATIGDQVQATIKTNLSNGREWINVKKIWPDSSAQFEIVSGPDTLQKDLSSMTVTWMIALFDTGFVRLPALALLIQNWDQVDTVYTNDVPIQVRPVEPDSTGLLPIKDIIRQPFNLLYYKKYIPHLIAVALIIFGLIYWWRRRKKEDVRELAPYVPLPHEWAFNALAELESKRLWQSGEIKEHYTLLTSVLREYLERRYGIHALEQTSDEILDQLRHQQLSPSLLHDIEQLLSVSDLIKFAKADPGIDIHAATIERVRNFVKQTMQVPSLITPATEKTNPDAPVE